MMIGMIRRWMQVILKPGDVVVTMFIYSDLSGAKTRSALVISRETYNETGFVVITA